MPDRFERFDSAPRRCWRRALGTLVWLVAIGAASFAQQPPGFETFEVAGVEDWSRTARQTGAVEIRDFPLSRTKSVDFDLERFFLTDDATRFVRGRRTDEDVPVLDFDLDQVVLLRGSVANQPQSRVVLAVSALGALGGIDLSGQRYWFSLEGTRLAVGPEDVFGGLPGAAPLCGVVDETQSRPAGRLPPPAGQPTRGVREIQLAVETDYELFTLFGNVEDVAAYVMSVYAVVSELFLAEINARIELEFLRLWDQPDDLFNEPDPLAPFRAYWELEMGMIERDVAQFLSGRRDLPWGGVAYVGGMCSTSAYSVAGYAIGFFESANRAHVFNRDLTVTAHELGHNANAPHTHSIDLDTCNDETSSARRGSLMSYCGQTFTGGAANTDLRFHTEIRAIMNEFIGTSTCLANDCNHNGVDDALDIVAGTSLDTDLNGVPDECEDCNLNEVLDSEDISTGESQDLDGDQVPDECQADCNGNSSPDSFDISTGSSLDLYGDGVPDECEADCDLDGISDYHQIQLDMSLDLDRDAVLDSCEDCDDDEVPDLVALDHANNLWVASLDHSTLREYLAQVGPLTGISAEAGIAEGQDVLITADRRVLVTSKLDHRVIEFTVGGEWVGDLVGPEELSNPAGLAATADGRLLVANSGEDSVAGFDLETGAPLGDLVPAGSGGLAAPFGLVLTPDEHELLVTSADHRVLRYDAATGSYLGELVSVVGNGGLLDPRGLLFLPSGNLLVASYGSDQVLEYDGESGLFVRQFNQGGTADRLTLDQPWGLRLGPDGGVYVSRAHDHEGHDRRQDPDGRRVPGEARLHLTNARIYHFDADTGFLLRAYILGLNSGIEHPTGFDFVPDIGLDCNLNLVPDACDIESGASVDANDNGIPDACEAEIFADGFESGDTTRWQAPLAARQPH